MLKVLFCGLLDWLGVTTDYKKGFNDGYSKGFDDGQFGGYHE